MRSNHEDLVSAEDHLLFLAVVHPIFISGSPHHYEEEDYQSATEESTSSTVNFLDKLSLPPYNPNHHLPQRAEELLKSLVNPIDFDLDEDQYLHPDKYPQSGPFFDLHRTRNVTALKGVTTNLICRVRRLGNHTVIPELYDLRSCKTLRNQIRPAKLRAHSKSESDARLLKCGRARLQVAIKNTAILTFHLRLN